MLPTELSRLWLRLGLGDNLSSLNQSPYTVGSLTIRNSELDAASPFTTAAALVLTSQSGVGHCNRPSNHLSTMLVVSPVIEEAAKLLLNHEAKSAIEFCIFRRR